MFSYLDTWSGGLHLYSGPRPAMLEEGLLAAHITLPQGAFTAASRPCSPLLGSTLLILQDLAPMPVSPDPSI